ncbi:branched-chain amino acid ABC transporter permease [Halorientalis sp.]|uniref:branched-chain amino acid ABC transporter permease n=1 Tax=Halorientalis sp. TaxID=1931229 RepID=UPI0026299231|nr:branched-chain amino acid ABC transporter permease [Halorientalis sp.]
MSKSVTSVTEESAYGYGIPLFDTRVNLYQGGVLAVLLVSLVTVPVWAPPWAYLFALANIWAIFAASWDIISGHTNYISFGHSFISGAAAYTTALLTFNVNPDMAIYITFPLSVIVAVVAALVFALPSLRLSGPYFSLLTFVSVLVATKAVFIFSTYTNGEMGISTVSVLTFDTTMLFYYTLVPAVIITGALLYISRSNVGKVLKAIGQNEAAVEAAGLDTTRFKLWGFVYSAIPMGIGGALLAHFYGNVEPIAFLIVDRSIEIIAIAAVGGMGTILGPAGAAYLFLFLRDEVFKAFLGPNARWVAIWSVVLVLLVLSPQGVLKRLWTFLGNLGGDSS